MLDDHRLRLLLRLVVGLLGGVSTDFVAVTVRKLNYCSGRARLYAGKIKGPAQGVGG
jgi:hypothetical protein